METCNPPVSLDQAVASFAAAVERAHARRPLIGPRAARDARRLRAAVTPGGIKRVAGEHLLRGRYEVDVEDPLAADRELRSATDLFIDRLTTDALESDVPDARRHKALIELVRSSSEVRLGDGCYTLGADTYQLDPAAEAIEAFYGCGAMGAWYRDTVARVHALESLYRPVGHLMNRERTPIDPLASAIFRYSADGRAIRSRGAIAEHLIERAAMEHRASTLRVLSLACGAARPVLHAKHEAARVGRRIDVELRDLDPAALMFARAVAVDLDIDGDGVDTGLIDLRRPESFEEIEPADVVEALGIVEYFPGRIAVGFLTQAMARVKPGGMLLFGNMLSSRPQLAFNRKVVSWPGLFPREIEEMTRLAERCGVGPEQIEVYIPDDGVYATYAWHKPA